MIFHDAMNIHVVHYVMTIHHNVMMIVYIYKLVMRMISQVFGFPRREICTHLLHNRLVNKNTKVGEMSIRSLAKPCQLHFLERSTCPALT